MAKRSEIFDYSEESLRVEFTQHVRASQGALGACLTRIERAYPPMRGAPPAPPHFPAATQRIYDWIVIYQGLVRDLAAFAAQANGWLLEAPAGKEEAYLATFTPRPNLAGAICGARYHAYAANDLARISPAFRSAREIVKDRLGQRARPRGRIRLRPRRARRARARRRAARPRGRARRTERHVRVLASVRETETLRFERWEHPELATLEGIPS